MDARNALLIQKGNGSVVNTYTQWGIACLKVPFKANVAEINKNLAAKKGTIFSLQLTKNTEKVDTVVSSDYAIVYPVVSEQLLNTTTEPPSMSAFLPAAYIFLTSK